MFAKVGFAKAWGCRPSELGLCDPWEDADIMFAYCMAKSTMDAYEDQLREEESKRKQRGRGRR